MSDKQYRILCKRAKEMGYKLTPTLKAELRMLAAIPDEEIETAYRHHVVTEMAERFQVPRAAMEKRLEGLPLPTMKEQADE